MIYSTAFELPVSTPERAKQTVWYIRNMKAGASIMIHAALLLIFGPQFDDDRYPYPALKKNRAAKTIMAMTAMHIIIV